MHYAYLCRKAPHFQQNSQNCHSDPVSWQGVTARPGIRYRGSTVQHRIRSGDIVLLQVIVQRGTVMKGSGRSRCETVEAAKRVNVFISSAGSAGSRRY